MAQASYWSRRSSNETATSDTLTNFLNLSTSSQGRSLSSGSNEWLDVIRQNQQDWEHIERIFYGEEPLPEDEKTRDEFQDWMLRFPHLRVIGKPVNTERFRTSRNPPIMYEEYIVLDPPGHSTMGRRPKEMISSRSGQILSRRFNNCGCDELVPSSSSISTLTSRNKVSGDRNKNKSLLTARSGGGWTSTSANLLRLPSVGGGSTKCTLETTRPSPLKTTVTLPILNVGKLTFGDLLTTRSISALHKAVGEAPRRSTKMERR